MLDQFKLITVKTSKDHYPDPLPLESFRQYALLLANSIQIQVNVLHLKYAVELYNIIYFAQVEWDKKLQLDMIVTLVSNPGQMNQK